MALLHRIWKNFIEKFCINGKYAEIRLLIIKYYVLCLYSYIDVESNI